MCADILNNATINTFHPQGGFYLFPDFSFHQEKLKDIGINTSTEFCQKILQDIGVAILPGTAFGMHENELVARLAYVDFDAPEEYNNFVFEDHAPKVLKGIYIIAQWIESI